MKKKVIFLIIFGMVFTLFYSIYYKKQVSETLEKKTDEATKTSSGVDKDKNNFLIEGYPFELVPLYKLTKVSSSKIFVNTDPKNRSAFDDTNYAYFNVVLYSDASQEEFLSYYKNLFESEYKEEFPTPNMVKGIVGKYKVSAAHYGSDKTGYIQVHMANYDDESLKKYFESFLEIINGGDYVVEHEKSYGLLNQKSGEVEYTKYLTVLDSGDKNNDANNDVDEFLEISNKYIAQYKTKPSYVYEEKTGTMTWNDGEFETNLVISKEHGRIYLMARKSIN